MEIIGSLRDALAAQHITPNQVKRLWARMDGQRDELLADITAYEGTTDTEEQSKLARSIHKK